jgi:hypothetical protein
LRLAKITKGSQSDNHLGAHAHHSGDPDTLALSALGWVLSDSQRAERLLSLTGLTPEVLRDNLTDRATLSAVLGFLEAHEPDLLLAADALNVTPEALVKAHAELAR